MRSETFADHYSLARQFYISQTPTEQDHIASAFTFELSKVETPAIRARVVSHLLNVDEDLARTVADGLRLKPMPEPAEAAMPTKELKPSPKLSILLNGPESFKGRKLGALVTDGVDTDLVTALQSALEDEGALIEFVAPMVGGVEASDGTWIEAKQKIDGGPSVLYDAVAVLASADGVQELVRESTAKDFVNDAFAHCKFIAYNAEAMPLFEKAGLVADLDDGCMELASPEMLRASLRLAAISVFGARAERQDGLSIAETIRAGWRRGRDSNPRDGYPPTHFPGVRLRPLGHPSIGTCFAKAAHYSGARPPFKRTRPLCGGI